MNLPCSGLHLEFSPGCFQVIFEIFLMAYQTRLCHVSDQYDLPTDLYPVAWVFVLWGLDRLSYLISTWVGFVSHPLLLSPRFPSRYILLFVLLCILPLWT